MNSRKGGVKIGPFELLHLAAGHDGVQRTRIVDDDAQLVRGVFHDPCLPLGNAAPLVQLHIRVLERSDLSFHVANSRFHAARLFPSLYAIPRVQLSSQTRRLGNLQYGKHRKGVPILSPKLKGFKWVVCLDSWTRGMR